MKKIKKSEWLTYYEVRLLDSDTHAEEELGGFIYAEDYGDAAAQLEEAFGKELNSINIIKMYDNDFLTMPVSKARSARIAYEDACGG